jgi:uncharacterized membrane protein
MVAGFLTLILSTALLAGSEFSIAALVHPALSHSNPKQSLFAIQLLGKIFGKVMPFWMGGTVLAHGGLAFACWQNNHTAPVYLLAAICLWVLVVTYSLLGPVPINDRVISWDLEHLPQNWQQERHLWDRLNLIRVVIIAVAFLCLVISFKDYLLVS